MLKKIYIDNYKTYTRPTEISFEATNYKFLEDENVVSQNGRRILKGALFIGENASGKTTILEALNFLIELFYSNDINFIRRQAIKKSFYTHKDAFELKYVFQISKNEISYSIAVGEKGIVSEELLLNNENVLSRKNNIGKYIDDNRRWVKDTVSENTSFLRQAYVSGILNTQKPIDEFIKYIGKSVYINCHNKIIITGEPGKFSHSSPIEFFKDNGLKKANDFLKKINYKQSFNLRKIPKRQLNGGAIDEETVLTFRKDGTDIEIPQELESIGNQAFASILPYIIDAVDEDRMLIIDEFSSGLHNELEECLMKYFFVKSKESQLFCVSHSTNLLNNTLIRPDQVYSVKFNGEEGSSLYRFSDRNPREAQNIEKMYLRGAFGYVPSYSKDF